MAKTTTKNKPAKDKIKAKAKAAKDKVKQKLKGAKTFHGAVVFALLSLALVGCMSTTPASRAVSNEHGDTTVEVVIREKSSHNTVSIPVTFGDGALQAADSSGSTETQTATPTLSIPVRIDARYNDMLAQASDATKATLSTIGSGLGAVLDMMMSGKSGKVDVTKSDGTAATVQCEGGQCEYVPGD